MSVLEYMAQGRVLRLEAKTHDNVSISIVNVHQATAKQHDLQRQVTLLLRAMIDTAPTQRRIMGGDFNAALSRYGYAQSTSALHDKVDKFFQDFVKPRTVSVTTHRGDWEPRCMTVPNGFSQGNKH